MFRLQIRLEFVENDQYCVQICGDLQITQLEECDDGNNIPYDGCHLCKYSCPLNCEICSFGECLECKIKYQLSLNKKYCQPFCYNGIQITHNIFDKQSNNQLEIINICQQRCLIEFNLCIDDKCLHAMKDVNLWRWIKCYQFKQSYVMTEIIMMVMVVMIVNLNVQKLCEIVSGCRSCSDNIDHNFGLLKIYTQMRILKQWLQFLIWLLKVWKLIRKSFRSRNQKEKKTSLICRFELYQTLKDNNKKD